LRAEGDGVQPLLHLGEEELLDVAERPAVGAAPRDRLLREAEIPRIAHEGDLGVEGDAQDDASVEAPAALALARRLGDRGEGKGRDLELLVPDVERAHAERDVLARGELERGEVRNPSRDPEGESAGRLELEVEGDRGQAVDVYGARAQGEIRVEGREG